MSDTPEPFEVDGKLFEHYADFPAFFQAQSSASTSGDIQLKLNVPRDGRDEAISLMDTDGEELRVIVARRVWEVADGDES